MSETDTIQQSGQKNRLIGGGVALLFHLLLLLFSISSGFVAVQPPPQDLGILIEFLPEPTFVVPRATPGQEPRALVPDPSQDVRLVQQAQHVEAVPGDARTQASTLGEFGEVELFEPPPPTEINQRALFRSRDTGDTLAEQSNRTATTTMQAGHPDGNTRQGNPDGTPSARLQGRSVDGSLPLPLYNANIGGTVVVRILVDQHGSVTSATINQTGTTVQNRTLWDAAVEAAKKAKFNTSGSAPVVQEGTITYEFRLR
ncbi:MAG: TonB family protein [Bacteroidales bacterium]|nr:TonB family protein [Bacteroidales bacterium]